MSLQPLAMKIYAFYLLTLLVAAAGCSSDTGSRKKASSTSSLKHPTAPADDEPRYNALLVEAIRLESYPIRRPDGKEWDNVVNGYFPDILLRLTDGGGREFVINEKPVENLRPTELPRQFACNHTITKLDDTYTIRCIDFDSFNSNDTLGACTFSAKKIPAGSNAYLLKNDNGLSMILTVRWMN